MYHNIRLYNFLYQYCLCFFSHHCSANTRLKTGQLINYSIPCHPIRCLNTGCGVWSRCCSLPSEFFIQHGHIPGLPDEQHNRDAPPPPDPCRILPWIPPIWALEGLLPWPREASVTPGKLILKLIPALCCQTDGRQTIPVDRGEPACYMDLVCSQFFLWLPPLLHALLPRTYHSGPL